MARLAAFATLLISNNAVAQQKPLAPHNDNPFNDKLNHYISDVMDDWKLPGLSIAVVDGDNTYTQSFGYATFPDVKVTPQTLFETGSTTKAFVAATLAQMIDSNNYTALSDGWSTPISSIIRDDFVLDDEWSTNHITLDDAASHRTGYPRHDLIDVGEWSAKKVVQNLRNLKPTKEPRTVWQYSNHMYVTLGHVIEVLSGKWIGDAIRETIWGPLGMTATFGDTKHAQDAPEYLATGYYWDERTKEYEALPVESIREHGGAGLVISNVVDYAKWLKALIHQTGPFSGSVHEELRKPRMLAPSQERTGPGQMSYGLAWHQKVAHGSVVMFHGGAEMAYGTQLYWLPEHKYGIVTLSNTVPEASCLAEEVVVWRLIEDKLGISQQDRFDIDGP